MGSVNCIVSVALAPFESVTETVYDPGPNPDWSSWPWTNPDPPTVVQTIVLVPEPPVIVKSIDPLSSLKHLMLKDPKILGSKLRAKEAGSFKIYCLVTEHWLESVIVRV